MRQEKGLTQDVLADESYLFQSFISNVETGKRKLLISSLDQIAEALEVEACNLLDENFLTKWRNDPNSQKPLSGEMSIYEIIGHNIRTVRHKKGLNQYVLAEQCGLFQNAISGIEQGKRHISVSLLDRIANALGVEPYKLLDENFIYIRQNKVISKKPLCPIKNANGNIFNLLRLAKNSLVKAGEEQNINEMINRVLNSHSYDNALQILSEYIEPCAEEEYYEEEHNIQRM